MIDTTEIHVLQTPRGRQYLVPAISARAAKHTLTDRIGDVPLEDLGTLDRHIDQDGLSTPTQSLVT